LHIESEEFPLDFTNVLRYSVPVSSNEADNMMRSSHNPIARSEKWAIIINSLANWIGFASAVVIVFFMSPILVHGLGDSRFGIWSLVDSVLAYVALADLGIGAAVVRFIAKFDGIRDQDHVNRVFSTSIAIFAIIGTIALAVTLAMALLWSRPIGVTADLVHDTRWLLVILGINLALGFPLGVYGAVLFGLARFPVRNGIRIGGMIIRNGLFLLVLRNGGGLPAIGIVITACGLAESACAAWASYHYLPGLHFSFRLVDRETFRIIRGYSIFVFLVQIAGRIANQSSAIIICAFLNPGSITFFALANTLVGYSRDTFVALLGVVTPTISKWEAQGDSSAIQGIFLAGTRCVLFVAIPVQLGLILFGHPFLSLWMGPRYATLSYSTLVVLAMQLAPLAAHTVAARILYGMGRIRLFSAISIAQALITVVCSVALVKPFGIEGVALAMTVPTIILCFATIALLCQVIHVFLVTWFMRSCVIPILSSFLPAFLWGALLWRSPPVTWLSLVAIGTTGMIPYVALVIVLEPQLQGIIRRIQKMGRLGSDENVVRNSPISFTPPDN
jgi:O-antigen/teichoic acid export membrane protein